MAVIPARGGSKRIPNKNIKDFCQKPILEYAITAAINTQLFSKIIVSTDSVEIAKFAQQLGAEVPFIRSPQLSDDYSNTDQVVQDVIIKLSQMGKNYEYISCIYATTPFLEPLDIENGFAALRANKSDFLLAVNRLRFPIERTYQDSGNGTLRLSKPDAYLTRSQDLPVSYVDSGQFYWGTPKGWQEVNDLGIGDPTYIELPWHKSIDLDTLQDWDMAERIFSAIHL